MPRHDDINRSELFTADRACNGLVLVHGGSGREGRADRLLSWYDAGTHVAPHEERCACDAGSGRPAGDCPRCHGTGRYLVMDNPDAKFAVARRVAVWDRWQVDELARFAAAHCAAIVTPDGEWHERGTMPDREWREETFYLLADHSHFTAMGYEFALVTSGR